MVDQKPPAQRNGPTNIGALPGSAVATNNSRKKDGLKRWWKREQSINIYRVGKRAKRDKSKVKSEKWEARRRTQSSVMSDKSQAYWWCNPCSRAMRRRKVGHWQMTPAHRHRGTQRHKCEWMHEPLLRFFTIKKNTCNASLYNKEKVFI